MTSLGSYDKLAPSCQRANEEEQPMDAYCVKCKAKKQMRDSQRVTMKNGRPAMRGKCPDCGTGLYRILKP